MALTLFVTTRIPILVASGVLKTDNQLLRLGKMTEATWAQKIEALKMAAEATSELAVLQVKGCLERGVQHMEYKDHTEFDCSCEEEYIFNEAVHLIEKHEMPFNSCVNIVVSDAEKEAEMQRWLAEDEAEEASSK